MPENKPEKKDTKTNPVAWKYQVRRSQGKQTHRGIKAKTQKQIPLLKSKGAPFKEEKTLECQG